MPGVERKPSVKLPSSAVDRTAPPARAKKKKPSAPKPPGGNALSFENKTVRAKLFLNGRSQAVRLPKEFRFEGKEVQISRHGSGVLLRPVDKRSRQQYWDAYFKALEPYKDLPFPDCEDTTVTEPEDIFAEDWV